MKTLISFTDTIRECDCCGRTNLKGTYLLVDENNNEFYYGSTCAMRQLSIKSGDEFKRISNLDNILKSVVSEASYMEVITPKGFLSLEDCIQLVIKKRKLRLPISNGFYNKEIQSSF